MVLEYTIFFFKDLSPPLAERNTFTVLLSFLYPESFDFLGFLRNNFCHSARMFLSELLIRSPGKSVFLVECLYLKLHDLLTADNFLDRLDERDCPFDFPFFPFTIVAANFRVLIFFCFFVGSDLVFLPLGRLFCGGGVVLFTMMCGFEPD